MAYGGLGNSDKSWARARALVINGEGACVKSEASDIGCPRGSTWGLVTIGKGEATGGDKEGRIGLLGKGKAGGRAMPYGQRKSPKGIPWGVWWVPMLISS